VLLPVGFSFQGLDSGPIGQLILSNRDWLSALLRPAVKTRSGDMIVASRQLAREVDFKNGEMEEG
jgi:hypothetical protein